MNPAWAAILVTLGLNGLIMCARFGVAIYKRGRAEGEESKAIQQIKEELENVYEAVSTNNDLQNQRHAEFYREFTKFCRKVAAHTGINGDD
jgi:hypothetical protein